MAYSAIAASHVGKHTRAGSKSRRPCPRCGAVREARASTVTCVDCNDTMSKEERRIWRRKAA